MNSEIYLVANATSPVLPAATGAAQGALLACFGKPSSSHAAGLREAGEHALGTPLLHGRAAYSLPLSRLADHGAWLGRETRPLVFFCRSGKRSAQAAQMARQFGHGNVRHLADGQGLLAP
jgi:cysteine desulfurase